MNLKKIEIWCNEYTKKVCKNYSQRDYHNNYMYMYSVLHFNLGSLLVEHLIGGTPMNPTPGPGPTGSVQDFSDESSEVSQSSYLTEKDLKPAGIVKFLIIQT